VETEAAVQAFVAEHVARVAPLIREQAHANWEAATTGSKEASARVAEVRAELLRIYASADDLARLRAWEAAGAVGDPRLARQLRLLVLAYERGQQDEATIQAITALERELRDLFNTFRGTFRGRQVSDNELEAVLRTEREAETLRAAWEASKQIGAQAAPKVRELARVRNAAARAQGDPDYFIRSLRLAEIPPDRLEEILLGLARLTEEPFRQAKDLLDRDLAAHYGIGVDELRPWHYQDPFFQRPPAIGPAADLDAWFADKDLVALTVRTYDGLGLEIRDLVARSDLFGRPGKNQHAFCTHIDRLTGDIRVLCNVEPNHRWATTLLHEFGHAVYNQGLGRDLPFLLRTAAHAITTEAVAMLLGRLTLDPEWLGGVAGIPYRDLAPVVPALRERQRLELLVFARWVLVIVSFERALYADPEQDLDALWWELVERYQLLTRPEAPPEGAWASKIHLSTHPVYYQNYLLGELMASQLGAALRQRFGGLVDRPEAGRWLVEQVFAPGASYDWDALTEHATGERLTASHFVRELEAA
jgi:peptidyl-dipeptidase A